MGGRSWFPRSLKMRLCVCLVCVGFIFHSAITSAAVANYASAAVMQTTINSCNPAIPGCHLSTHQYPASAWSGNQADLIQLTNRLALAAQVVPHSQTVRLRLAEMDFAVGNHSLAASLLPVINPTVSPLGFNSSPADYRSVLLSPGRYESNLVIAYQQLTLGRWDNAVREFRMAMAVAPESLLTADYEAFYTALAEDETRQGGASGLDAHVAYLAGAFFVQAHNWDSARAWLERLEARDMLNGLTNEEQARVFMDLGLTYESTANPQAAEVMYRRASDRSPSTNEPQFYLVRILSRLHDTTSESSVIRALADRGPRYQLGAFGAGQAVAWPATAPSGQTLIGYDVDPETVGAGGLVDLWLWWRGGVPSGMTPGTWLQIGPFAVQHLLTPNLAPNANFSWPGPSSGVPSGFESENYGAPPSSLAVVYSAGPTGDTSALQISSPIGHLVGLRSWPIPVQSNDLYLTAAWLRTPEDQTQAGQIGRLCSIPNNEFYPVYIGPGGTAPTNGGWLHVAQASTPVPGKAALACRLWLYNKKGSTQWDQLLFVRIGD